MRSFERLVAVCAVLSFIGFAIAGCLAPKGRQQAEARIDPPALRGAR